MNIGEILSLIDSIKRRVGSTVQDVAANPKMGLLSMYDTANANAKDYNQRMGGLLGDMGSVIPEVSERGLEGLLGEWGGTMPMTFAGVGAKTANKGLLAKAQELTAKGAEPGDVWKTTGWTDQFPDGKWRFEIPDNRASIKGTWLDQYDQTKRYLRKREVSQADIDAMRKLKHTWPIDQVMAHKPLWDSYPDDIKKYPMRLDTSIDPAMGAFSDAEKSISLMPAGDNVSQRSTLLHELQHAVQQREGFARGGSPEGLALNPETFSPKIKQLKEAVENQAQNAGGRVSELYRKAYNGSGLNFKEAGEFEQLKKALP
jgi:hypothetical protein